MQKVSDALSKAWETINTPIIAADAAMREKREKQDKEQKSLYLAVKRNARERKARRLAGGMAVKVGDVKENDMAHSGGQSESASNGNSLREKQAIHQNISRLMDDLPRSGPTKGIKVTKKTVSVKPIVKVTKVKKPVTVCDLKKKAYEMNIPKEQRVKLAMLIVKQAAHEKEAFRIGKMLSSIAQQGSKLYGRGSKYLKDISDRTSQGIMGLGSRTANLKSVPSKVKAKPTKMKAKPTKVKAKSQAKAKATGAGKAVKSTKGRVAATHAKAQRNKKAELEKIAFGGMYRALQSMTGLPGNAQQMMQGGERMASGANQASQGAQDALSRGGSALQSAGGMASRMSPFLGPLAGAAGAGAKGIGAGMQGAAKGIGDVRSGVQQGIGAAKSGIQAGKNVLSGMGSAMGGMGRAVGGLGAGGMMGSMLGKRANIGATMGMGGGMSKMLQGGKQMASNMPNMMGTGVGNPGLNRMSNGPGMKMPMGGISKMMNSPELKGARNKMLQAGDAYYDAGFSKMTRAKLASDLSQAWIHYSYAPTSQHQQVAARVFVEKIASSNLPYQEKQAILGTLAKALPFAGRSAN